VIHPTLHLQIRVLSKLSVVVHDFTTIVIDGFTSNNFTATLWAVQTWIGCQHTVSGLVVQ